MTAYGLFVEHYQKYEVIWNGRNGTDIFFQNEMPYDPPSQAAWRAGPDRRLPGVPGHPAGVQLPGLRHGQYCFFDQGVPIDATSAFEMPNTPGGNSRPADEVPQPASGGIDNVVNTTGRSSTARATHAAVDVISYP